MKVGNEQTSKHPNDDTTIATDWERRYTCCGVRGQAKCQNNIPTLATGKTTNRSKGQYDAPSVAVDYRRYVLLGFLLKNLSHIGWSQKRTLGLKVLKPVTLEGRGGKFVQFTVRMACENGHQAVSEDKTISIALAAMGGESVRHPPTTASLTS